MPGFMDQPIATPYCPKNVNEKQVKPTTKARRVEEMVYSIRHSHALFSGRTSEFRRSCDSAESPDFTIEPIGHWFQSDS